MKHTLKRQSDFQTIYSQRHIKDSKYFRIYKDEDIAKSPLTAIVASKKLGNAVSRNKLKRRVRHILQHIKLKKNCIIIIKTPAKTSSYLTIKDSLTELLT